MAIASSAARYRSRVLAWGRPSATTAGLAIVFIFTMIMAWPLLHDGTMIGQDSAAFFYPMYHFLGQQLAHGHIPGWNPYQFSGVPFAADPESGWMYLPAMVLFALLPLEIAARTYLVLHLLLAGFGAFGLARVLKMNLMASVVAATAYEFTGLLYGRSACCPAYLQVAAWLPIIFLCMELAIQEQAWLPRSCWWGLTGLGISQVIASWIGQGTYYVLLALGGYIGYRTLIAPPEFARSPRARLIAAVTNGGVVLAFGLGLAAAGILPRLDYESMTNLAHGYSGDLSWASVLGGWSAKAMVKNLTNRTLNYAGGVTLVLAVVGIIIARARHAAPYFFFLAAAALILAAKRQTPLHHLLYAILPQFEELHRHWPERDMIVFYLALAMLAGAAVSSLGHWTLRPDYLIFAALIPVLAAWLLQNHGYLIATTTVSAIAVASLLLVAYALVPTRSVRLLVPLLLVVVMFADLRSAGQFIMQHGLYGGNHKVDLAAYYDPQSAGAYLEALQAEPGSQPFRYFGYDPSIGRMDQKQFALYRDEFFEPEATALLVNNRATVFGLQDIQGYDPIQLQSYVEYMTALNGHPQEYHGSYVFPEGLDSPLLNLLNARYIVIPGTIPASRPDLTALIASHPTVYQDSSVRVLLNQNALPRAWLVHEARQVTDQQTLDLLASGQVNPRHTALMTAAPPSLPRVASTTDDHATVTSYAPNRIAVTTTSGAASLLMLSEIYDPNWHATVDGKSVKLYQADHILRAVPVPAGTHTVVLHYASRSLNIGLGISIASALVLLGLFALLMVRRLRHRRSAISRGAGIS